MNDADITKKFDALLSAIITLNSIQERRDAAINKQLDLLNRRLGRIEKTLGLSNSVLRADIVAPLKQKTNDELVVEGLELPAVQEPETMSELKKGEKPKRRRGRPKKSL